MEQFHQTKLVYDTFPQTKEFVIMTREYWKVYNYLKKHKLLKDVKLKAYTVNKGFNCSKALNMGVRLAKYDQIIVTSPEVKPTTQVLEQLEKLIGTNVICQVADEGLDGEITIVLVHRGFRDSDPSMYFLAMFNKSDIEKINGWDEDFMNGYAYEDNDFGARWARAGLPWELHEEIRAVHQYHPRSETIPAGLDINRRQFEKNNALGIIYCKNGLK